MNIQTHTEQVGSHVIHFVEAGTGEPLLLLHGINCGWRQWQESLGAFAKNFHVYAMDLPGAGESSTVDWFTHDPEQEIGDAIMGFIRAKGLIGVRVVAHSFTAWVALQLAQKYPKEIREVVLVSPMGLTTFMPFVYRLIARPFFVRLFARTAMKPTKANLKKFLESAVKNKSGITKDFLHHYTAAVGANALRHPFFLIHQLAKRLRAKTLLLTTPVHLSQKTLLMLGGKDPLIPLSRAQKSFTLLPNATVHIFPESGHVPMVEDTPTFIRVVQEFFNR